MFLSVSHTNEVFLCDLDGVMVSCSQVNFTFRVRIPAFAIKNFEDFFCNNIVPIICGYVVTEEIVKVSA